MARPRIPAVVDREERYRMVRAMAERLAALRPGPDQLKWWRDAACRAASNKEIFYPDHDIDPDGPDAATLAGFAKTFCNGDTTLGREVCPVRTECLAYAMDHHERHGIWGGMTPAERNQMRRTGYEAERLRGKASPSVTSTGYSTLRVVGGTDSEIAV